MSEVEKIVKSFKEDVDAYGKPKKLMTKVKQLIAAVVSEAASEVPWIPVEEELPGDERVVLIYVYHTDLKEALCISARRVEEKWYAPGKDGIRLMDGTWKVTHWKEHLARP